MTSEGVVRDFWSMRSDEAGTTSKRYVFALKHVLRPTNHTGTSAEAELRARLRRNSNTSGAANATEPWTEHAHLSLDNTPDEGADNYV